MYYINSFHCIFQEHTSEIQTKALQNLKGLICERLGVICSEIRVDDDEGNDGEQEMHDNWWLMG